MKVKHRASGGLHGGRVRPHALLCVILLVTLICYFSLPLLPPAAVASASASSQDIEWQRVTGPDGQEYVVYVVVSQDITIDTWIQPDVHQGVVQAIYVTDGSGRRVGAGVERDMIFLAQNMRRATVDSSWPTVNSVVSDASQMVLWASGSDDVGDEYAVLLPAGWDDHPLMRRAVSGVLNSSSTRRQLYYDVLHAAIFPGVGESGNVSLEREFGTTYGELFDVIEDELSKSYEPGGFEWTLNGLDVANEIFSKIADYLHEGGEVVRYNLYLDLVAKGHTPGSAGRIADSLKDTITAKHVLHLQNQARFTGKFLAATSLAFNVAEMASWFAEPATQSHEELLRIFATQALLHGGGEGSS